MRMSKEIDVYDLINSKAISEYCRSIKHQFNIEEVAVLIHRNKENKGLIRNEKYLFTTNNVYF